MSADHLGRSNRFGARRLGMRWTDADSGKALAENGTVRSLCRPFSGPMYVFNQPMLGHELMKSGLGSLAAYCDLRGRARLTNGESAGRQYSKQQQADCR